jgi:hypothetical protein
MSGGADICGRLSLEHPIFQERAPAIARAVSALTGPLGKLASFKHRGAARAQRVGPRPRLL